FKLIVPFVVLNGTAQNNKPSFSSTVTKGEKLVLNFNRDFGFAFALLLKNVSYDTNIKVDLTKKITESLKANLTYSGKELEEIKLFDKNLGIFAPKGMFSYNYTTEGKKLELETSALETGEYILYVISFEKDSVIPMFVGSLKVQVAPPTTPTPTPTTPRPILGGGAGGGGAMPGVPVYITAYITVKANEESIIDLPQSAFWETNVVALLILSSEDNNIRFRIEKLKELPSGIPEPKGDLVVLILSIEPTLSKEASIKGKIKFGIPIEEIKAKGFDPNLVAVILLKWNGKEWIELPTKFVGSDGKYNYYEAETTSFSYFVAQLRPLETPTPTPVVTTPTTLPATPPTTPLPPATTPPPTGIGIEILGAVVVVILLIAAIAYMLRRRK
ncbi:MAG: PGF-pre-PGF domain-containing protein, partial [Archaeoglobaceae archaeon]